MKTKILVKNSTISSAIAKKRGKAEGLTFFHKFKTLKLLTKRNYNSLTCKKLQV